MKKKYKVNFIVTYEVEAEDKENALGIMIEKLKEDLATQLQSDWIADINEIKGKR